MGYDLPDDALEHSVFDHILGADSVGSVMAAVTASGPQPAFGTPKDQERDPAGILSIDEEIVRRRIAQVAPDGAAHYVALLETIRDRNRRATPVEQTFHAAREMVGAVAEACCPSHCPSRSGATFRFRRSPNARGTPGDDRSSSPFSAWTGPFPQPGGTFRQAHWRIARSAVRRGC